MMAERDMGRILLDLSDDVIQRLDDLKVQRNIPRAELLREAVEQYLEKQYLEKQDRAKDTISSALGLWQDCEEDGMEYQRQLRKEW
ncbi:TPA: CopG family transcriptional regulator [Klebsiella pneumoniae]